MVSNIRLFGYLLHFVSADYCSLFFCLFEEGIQCLINFFLVC